MTTNNLFNWSLIRSIGLTNRAKTLACSFLAFACFVATSSVKAQVTIGSQMKPAEGALLDLKEGTLSNNATSTKGMILPRVALSHKNELYPMFGAPGMEDNDYVLNRTLYKQRHIGMTVFNVSNVGDFTSGVHSWNGTEWRRSDDSPVIQPVITGLVCGSAQMTPNTYKSGTYFEGILKVPYLGGNGGSYPGTTPVSIGNGLFIERIGGRLAYGGGEAMYRVFGNPTVSSPTETNIPSINFLTFTCSNIKIGNGMNGINLRNLLNPVTISTLRPSSGDASNADILPFGSIHIPESGSYAFSIRLYGQMVDMHNRSGRLPFYIYLQKADRTVVDAAEIDVVVVSQAVSIQDYSYSVTLGGSFVAGDNVIISMHRPGFSQWALKQDQNPANPIRTSLIYWKL